MDVPTESPDESVRLYLLPSELARADAAGYIERDADGTMWSNAPNLPRTRVVLRELRMPRCA